MAELVHAYRRDPAGDHERQGQRANSLRKEAKPQQHAGHDHHREQAKEDRADGQDAAQSRHRAPPQRAVGWADAGRLRAGHRGVGWHARLQVAAEVVHGQAGLLQHSRGGGRIRVEKRQQQVDRVDRVVAEHQRLAVGVDEQLPQRKGSRHAVGWKGGSHRGRIRTEAAQRAHRKRGAVGQHRAEDVDRVRFLSVAPRGFARSALEILTRGLRELYVRGCSIEREGGVRHRLSVGSAAA